MDRLYTCEEVADLYGVKKTTVWGWIRKGILSAVKVGKFYRIRENDLSAFEKSSMSAIK